MDARWRMNTALPSPDAARRCRRAMKRLLAAASCLVLVAACATLPPGRDYPRAPLPVPEHDANPALVTPFAAAVRAHPDAAGFRLYSVGVDGLLLRLELIRAAQGSLDLQYYIFHGDESGRLVTEALAQAAERGVQVRILIDDAETERGDEQLFALAGHPNIAIRVFNPWRYRGHNVVLRGLEWVFNKGRLDYRMHNKLFVADGTLALIGGRNIGDEYFQVDPESQYADDDLLVAGPAVPQLDATFTAFWDSESAVPAQALLSESRSGRRTARAIAQRGTVPQKAATAGFNYQEKLAANEPLADVLAGTAPLSWAGYELACDSPDKKAVAEGWRAGRLTFGPVAHAIEHARSEVTIVNPYLVPTPEELALLERQRAAGRRVRILTTSLEASKDPLAQAGYTRYRVPLLESGVELFEIRARPGSRRGSGESKRLTRTGNYGLHAKLMAFDAAVVFVGSMNFDQRSRWLNTEDGLVVHSAELAQETLRRFAAMTEPQNAYSVKLEPGPLGRERLLWSTEQDGHAVTYDREPARSLWQRTEVRVLTRVVPEREL
jgi:putative cardiolipin synthase